MLLAIYNILWYICIPILYLFPRIREGFAERLGKGMPRISVDVWIQSASAGEALLVETMLKELPLKADFSCMLTTWTKEGRAILERVQAWAKHARPQWHVGIRYFPFDTKKNMASMCSASTPNLVILIETELWPRLLKECVKKHIPVCIVNGRMSANTVGWYTYIQHIFLHSEPKYIYAISEDDAKRFSAVFPNSCIKIMNNIKFTSVDITTPVQHGYFKEAVALFASIRKQEFPYIVRCITKLMEESSAKSYVLVPRHPHHIHLLEKLLHKQGLPYILCTHKPENNARLQGIIIWDIFGTLSQVYAEANAVFVGGSLYKKYGGQNFLEALASGKVPIVGSYRDNFIWAEKGLKEQGLLEVIHTEEEFVDAIKTAIGAQIDTAVIVKAFALWLTSKKNAIEQCTVLFQEFGCVV